MLNTRWLVHTVNVPPPVSAGSHIIKHRQNRGNVFSVSSAVLCLFSYIEMLFMRLCAAEVCIYIRKVDISSLSQNLIVTCSIRVLRRALRLYYAYVRDPVESSSLCRASCDPYVLPSAHHSSQMASLSPPTPFFAPETSARTTLNLRHACLSPTHVTGVTHDFKPRLAVNDVTLCSSGCSHRRF